MVWTRLSDSVVWKVWNPERPWLEDMFWDISLMTVFNLEGHPVLPSSGYWTACGTKGYAENEASLARARVYDRRAIQSRSLGDLEEGGL